MSESAPAHLRIFTRCTHHGEGRVDEAHTLVCPRQEKTLAAGDCFQCERLIGVRLAPSGGHYELSCYADADPAQRPARPDQTPIGEIMTREVHCVTEATSVDALVELFLDANISGAPVVDAGGKPVGVVSKTDVLRSARDDGDTRELSSAALAELKARGLEEGYRIWPASTKTVGEIMTSIDFSLHETATIGAAAALMSFEGVHRVPVVSAEGVVIGIVSSMDVLRFVATTSGYLR